MSEQIRREIEHFQQRLDFAGEDEHLKRSIRESIAHLRRKCLMVESLESFRSILRPAHAQILEMLSEQINQNISDHLLRRSYVISFFGTVCSALLDRPAYSHMKAFFPSLKLPLLISDADRTIFRTAFYRNVSLKNCVKNFLLDYKVHLFKVRREENLRSLLWAPILQSFICSLKREFVVDELDLALEYNFKDVGDFAETRFVDFAAGPSIGRHGRPILLIEIAADEVPHDLSHKDFRKMALMMSHLLMELVQRAKSHCPDYDIAQLRVYGILAAGLSFEFCVGTIATDPQGRINFVFNTNSKYWTFKFNHQATSDEYTENHICQGNHPIAGAYRQFESDLEANSARIIEKLFSLSDIIEQQEADAGEEEEAAVLEAPNSNARIEDSIITLWKFLRGVVQYYAELPRCLQECISTRQIPTREAKKFAMLPKTIRPQIAPSASSHRAVSDTEAVSHIQRQIQIIGCSSLSALYKLLANRRIPTLPDVYLYDPSENVFLIRESRLSMVDYEAGLDFRAMTKGNLTLLVAKFFLDMLVAAYHLHNEGMVCGAFEPAYIAFDGLFWRLNSTPKACTFEEARNAGKPEFDREDCHYFHLNNVQFLSPRDDLFGVAKSALYGFSDQMRRILWEYDEVPLFADFAEETFTRMVADDRIDAASLLLASVPAFNVMLQKFRNTDTPASVVATQALANELVRQFLGQRRTSVETQPIVSPAVEET